MLSPLRQMEEEEEGEAGMEGESGVEVGGDIFLRQRMAVSGKGNDV